MVLYSKAYKKCDAADKRREEAEENEFPNKFEGRYKSMEADAILNKRKQGRKRLHIMRLAAYQVKGSGQARGGPMGLVSSGLLGCRDAKEKKTGNCRLTC